MAATNDQVQAFADTEVRPISEMIRAVNVRSQDAQARIDDVFANLVDSSTWGDQRTDNPPHLLTPNDVLAWNAFVANLVAIFNNATTGSLNTDQKKIDAVNAVANNYATIVDACVRSIGA